MRSDDLTLEWMLYSRTMNMDTYQAFTIVNTSNKNDFPLAGKS
jgi:hypothetical protein